MADFTMREVLEYKEKHGCTTLVAYQELKKMAIRKEVHSITDISQVKTVLLGIIDLI